MLVVWFLAIYWMKVVVKVKSPTPTAFPDRTFVSTVDNLVAMNVSHKGLLTSVHAEKRSQETKEHSVVQ